MWHNTINNKTLSRISNLEHGRWTSSCRLSSSCNNNNWKREEGGNEILSRRITLVDGDSSLEMVAVVLGEIAGRDFQDSRQPSPRIFSQSNPLGVSLRNLKKRISFTRESFVETKIERRNRFKNVSKIWQENLPRVVTWGNERRFC